MVGPRAVLCPTCPVMDAAVDPAAGEEWTGLPRVARPQRPHHAEQRRDQGGRTSRRSPERRTSTRRSPTRTSRSCWRPLPATTRSNCYLFYGPALLPELGEHPTVLAYTDAWLRAAWFGDAPLRFAPARVWTDEFLDWDQRRDLTRPREVHPSEGWVTIREGAAEGPLVGGCLETIGRHLLDSQVWLDLRGSDGPDGR